MEQLKSELTLALGETISRLELISEHPPTRLYALYDRQGHPMPWWQNIFVIRGGQRWKPESWHYWGRPDSSLCQRSMVWC